jgi:two-component system NtrC family sensor kinase
MSKSRAGIGKTLGGLLCGLTLNGAFCAKGRYQGLQRRLLGILLLIGIIPLSVMASLSFIQYRTLLQEETNSNARLSAESARQTIEAYLQKLTTAIQIISDAYSFAELADQERLDKVFARLNQDFFGVVDLSVIGPDGIQQAYAGPFNLVGKNYLTSEWYTRTLAKKIYISEVFMGYRHVPHFVIAVGKMMPQGQDHWVLRASIDTEKLDRFMASIYSEVVTDVFLVNANGELQNSSRHYGKVNDHFPLPDLPPMRSIRLEEQGGKKSLIHAFGHIEQTPWIVVLELQDYAGKTSWLVFKRQVLWLFAICITLVIIIAFRVARHVAMTVRRADDERNAILAQTEHTNKLASVGRLAAGVAHEINNPLAIINEKAGLMKDLLELTDEFVYKEKFMKQLTSLQGAVDRSRTITHRLLGFARRMDVKFEPVQINDVILEVLGFLTKEASYHNIEITQELQTDLPLVRSDRGQLQQVFLNIINNAIDAVGKDGDIRITSFMMNDNHLQVDIVDNGPGMSHEVMSKIFEPFFTTKNNNERQGTGLGLSITYGLVKKLGGEIYVDSTVGTGSTFTLVFPIMTIEPGAGGTLQ